MEGIIRKVKFVFKNCCKAVLLGQDKRQSIIAAISAYLQRYCYYVHLSSGTIKKGVWVIFLFFVFFCFRFYHLGFHELWYDEIYSVEYAKSPWFNWNAPLYWIILHFWAKLFGFSEFSLRFPSLLFSFFSVILAFLLGKELFNKTVGFIATIFMGLSPFHLWYSQEARDYSMVLFFGLSSSYFLFKALKEDRTKLWLFFVLISLLGMYTNYFYIFLFFAQFLYLIFFKRLRVDFKEIIGFLIIAFGFSFYLHRFLSKFYYVWGGFWIPKPQWKSLIITLENFILGYNGTAFLYLISDVFTGLFFIFALAAFYKRKEWREGFLFCLFLLFIPIISVFIFSKVFFSIYLDRGLIIFSPYFYLILSSGLVFLNTPARIASFVILIPFLLCTDFRYYRDQMSVSLVHHLGTYIKKPVKPLVKFLEDNAASDDIISFTNNSVIPSIIFYSERKLGPFYYFFDPQFPDSSWQRPIVETKYCIPFYKVGLLKFKRLWVVSCNWARDGSLDENSQSVKSWLDRNLKLEFKREFDGLWVFRYVRK